MSVPLTILSEDEQMFRFKNRIDHTDGTRFQKALAQVSGSGWWTQLGNRIGDLFIRMAYREFRFGWSIGFNLERVQGLSF